MGVTEAIVVRNVPDIHSLDAMATIRVESLPAVGDAMYKGTPSRTERLNSVSFRHCYCSTEMSVEVKHVSSSVFLPFYYNRIYVNDRGQDW